MAAFVAFFTALPALITLLTDIWNTVKDLSKGDPAKWLLEVHQTIEQVKSADTPEKKAVAAKSLADLVSKL